MTVPSKSLVVSSLKWQTLSKTLTQVVSWGSTILVMRLLSPNDYGLMAMAMVVLGFVTLISEMGFGSALVQSKDINDYQQRCLFGAALVVNSTAAILVAASAPAIAAFFSEPRLEMLITLLCIQLPMAALTTIPESIARRKMAFKSLSFVEMGCSLVSATVTCGAALAGWEVWALATGQAVVAVLRPTLLIAKFGILSPAFGYKGIESLISFGSSLTVNRIVWYFYTQADMLIAGKLLGKEILGAYSVAVSLAALPMQKISSIANQVIFSSFSRIQDQQQKVSEATVRTVELIGLIAFPLSWGLAGTAQDFIPLVLGEKWSPAILPLQILAIITPLRIVSSLTSTIAIGVGLPKLDLLNTLTSATLIVPAFFFGAYYFGSEGLAYAWAFVYPICFIIILSRISTQINLPMMSIFYAMLPSVLSAVTMVIATQGFRNLTSLPQSISLLGQVCVGIVVFAIATSIFNPKIKRDVIIWTRNKFAKAP
jgi:teichuronic acid exporter